MNRVADREILAALAEASGNKTAAAESLGWSRTHFRRRLEAIQNQKSQLGEIPTIPSRNRPLDELIADRCKEYQRRTNNEMASRLITVDVLGRGPIGILHFGDPHLDDEGTNMPLIVEHVTTVQETDGLYGASIGDYSNNWIGNLARLYAYQQTKQPEAVALVRWFIESLKSKWIYLVAGNHDAWLGNTTESILGWLAKQADAPCRDDGLIVALRFTNGRTVRINARHDFSGRSQWNSAHGPTKASMLDAGDDVYIAGHTHDPAIMEHWRGKRKATCIRVGSYKRWDDFASKHNFPDSNRCPSVLTVIDPDATDENDLVTAFSSVRRGVEYLKMLRATSAADKPASHRQRVNVSANGQCVA